MQEGPEASRRESSGVRWRKSTGTCSCFCRARGRSIACARCSRDRRRRAARARGRLQILPLYGELSAEEQDAALMPASPGLAPRRARDQHRRDQPDHSGRAGRRRFGAGSPPALRSGDRHEPPRDGAHLARFGGAETGQSGAGGAGGVLSRLERECAAESRPVQSRGDRRGGPDAAGAGARELGRARCSCARDGSIRRRPRCWRARATCSSAWALSMPAAASRRTAARWRGSACTRGSRTCCCGRERPAPCRSPRIWPRCCRSGICCAGPPVPAMPTSAAASRSLRGESEPGGIDRAAVAASPARRARVPAPARRSGHGE